MKGVYIAHSAGPMPLMEDINIVGKRLESHDEQ
jgi:hypothetical protein